MASNIYIVPVGSMETAEVLGPLSRFLARTFGTPTQVWKMPFDLDRAYDPLRKQYNSSTLLLTLIQTPPADAFRLLGVSDVDLFVPILTFLFGEAQFEGIGALVSTHRLRSEFYGLGPDPDLLMERLFKEAVHELGHTYGLVHCPAPGCVMNTSTDVTDIDTKSVLFCPECKAVVDAWGRGG